MENEIKVGEYIRTKDGVIDKIVDIRDTYSERKLIAFEKSNSLKSDIGLKAMVVKHSSNLIDLIECGDYVNGIKIISIIQQADTIRTISLCGFDNDYLDIKLNNRDIKRYRCNRYNIRFIRGATK